MENTNSRINPDDAIILFADLQSGIIELTATTTIERLRKGVRSLARLAKLLQIPVIVTGIQGDGGEPAKITPEIAEILGEPPTLHRTTCDAFLNPEIVSAIKATKRKTLLISGVATELAVQLPALS